MSRASSLVAKANRILGSTNAFSRKVYIRTTVNTGGDTLLGRYGSSTPTDVLISPQPFVERLGRERIPGGHATSETLAVGSDVKIGDDYSVIVSSSMVTVDQLQDPLVQFVFKDNHGAEETLVMHDFETVTIDSTDVLYVVYCRSVQNQ